MSNFRFVATDSVGLPQKRKQAGSACELCRKRKKRCNHLGLGSADNEGLSAALVEHLASHPRRSTDMEAYSDGHQTSPIGLEASITPAASRTYDGSETTPTGATCITPAASRTYDEQDDDDAHFVGDLNPEAIFLAATSPETTVASSQNDVGVWSSRRAIARLKASVAGKDSRPVYPSSIYTSDPLVSKLLLPYLQDQCLRLVPQHADYMGLQNIYFADVHPLFPILNQDNFALFSDQLPEKVLLKQAICLAASTNGRAKTFLRFENETKLSHKSFAAQLSRAMRTALELGLVRDQSVVLQVLAILSLFMQLSNERHLAADLNSRVVSLGHTMGLHLQPSSASKDKECVTRFFCCVWALDRLNAAFHGRPVLMHERDFGHDLSVVFGKQQPCFQLLLRIILLLDQVIALYRPGKRSSGSPVESTFPSFEDLVRESGALRVHSYLLATAESLYHAVSMLSCRSKFSEDNRQSTSAQVRQSLSAIRVTSIVGEEFPGQLSLLPFVPYALSLSLRVSYRELRLNKAPIFTMRARRQLLANCTLLRQLGDIFESAMMMVELAEQVLAEMDKVCSSMAGILQQDPSRRPSAANIGEEVGSAGLPPNPSRNAISGVRQDYAANPNGNGYGGVTDVDTTAANLSVHWEPNGFDQSIFDAMGDFDIFQHFDPDFDLETIDATLGNSINPSFAMNLSNFAG